MATTDDVVAGEQRYDIKAQLEQYGSPKNTDY